MKDRFKVPMTFLRAKVGKLEFWPRIATEVQRRWEQEDRQPRIRPQQAHIADGRVKLRTLGIPEGAWYATLHVRNASEKTGDRANFSRNARIEDYRLAVERVVATGGYVISLGEPSMPTVDFGKGFIDYAHSDAKSEAMDIFLVSQARFHIGTNSGMSIVPGIFGVPCAYTNWSPSGTFSWYGNSLYCLKLLKKSSGEFVSFAEMVRSPLGSCESLYYTDAHGLELVDNTPDEIAELVSEMLEMLEDRLELSADDLSNQARLDRLIECESGYGRCRLGRSFLRKYAHLLPAD
jgi:putative glycosyltransferase (TIGR04372 family)